MDHHIEESEELIDLGAASAETKGVAGPPEDEIGRFKLAGLTDD